MFLKTRVYRGWLSTLFFGLTLALTPAGVEAQTDSRPQSVALAKGSITLREFRSAVLAAKPIENRVVPSSYLSRVLEEGPLLIQQASYARIKMVGCRIEGADIHLQEPSRPKAEYRTEIQNHLSERGSEKAVYVALPIELRNTKVEVVIDFSGIVFQNSLSIADSEVARTISFQGAVFQQLTVFDHVTFADYADFSGIHVLDVLSFNNCKFSEQAHFSNATLQQEAKLVITSDKLDVPLDFSGSVVFGKLTLQGSASTLHMSDKVYLNGVNKKQTDPVGELQIKNAEFHDSFYLDQGKWNRVDFAETQDGLHRPIRFDGFCDFRESIFNVVDLGGAEFERGGDFSKAEFRTAINFERTKLREPFRIQWSQLYGKLRHVQKVPNKPETDTYLSRESYEELERNFKALQALYSENECNYEKRTRWEGRGFEWAISGYWVRPWRTLTWLIIVFSIAWITNQIAFKRRWFRSVLSANVALNSLKIALRAAALKATLPKGFWASKAGWTLFLAEYACLKVLEVFLIVTLSNASALLKQLLPYFKLG